jgi:hypothetical protein
MTEHVKWFHSTGERVKYRNTGRVRDDSSVRLPKQSRSADTREDLLRAGWRVIQSHLAEEHVGPATDVLEFVTINDTLREATEIARERLVVSGILTDTAEVAPLSTGAFYKAFAGLTDADGNDYPTPLIAFHRALVNLVMEQHSVRRASAQNLIDDTGEAISSGGDLDSIIKAVATNEFNLWKDDASYLIACALSLHARDPEIGQLLRRTDQEMLSQLDAFYETALPALGLRLRPGIEVRHLARSLSALFTGMVLEHRTAPDDFTNQPRPDIQGRQQEWVLPALAARAIVLAYTEPVDPPPSSDGGRGGDTGSGEHGSVSSLGSTATIAASTKKRSRSTEGPTRR